MENLAGQRAGPQNLPRCDYPKAADFRDHGLYQLPLSLASVNWEAIKKYRSQKFKALSVAHLSKVQILDMARMVAYSFVENEPMKKHLQPPLLIPETLHDRIHGDPFGNDRFGDWTSENILFWVIRLLILTNPSDPIERIRVNTDSIDLSVVILDENETVIGGAFNVVAKLKEVPFRSGDSFLDAVMLADKPIFDLISSQEHQAIEALNGKYPDFRAALEDGKVGLHFMIARSLTLPKEDAFELVAASAEMFQTQGFEFMLVTASNQWTGAACEALHGTRVHFMPFRDTKRVSCLEKATAKEAYSIDGYISAKDSGAMFYVVKLN